MMRSNLPATPQQALQAFEATLDSRLRREFHVLAKDIEPELRSSRVLPKQEVFAEAYDILDDAWNKAGGLGPQAKQLVRQSIDRKRRIFSFIQRLGPMSFEAYKTWQGMVAAQRPKKTKR